MARTELALQSTARTGLNPTYSAATVDGFGINNASEQVILHVKNGNAAACTVTIQTPKTIDGLALPDLTVSVPATTGDRFIGPFPKALYNQVSVTPAIDEAVYVDFSIQASVTAAAIKLGSLSY